MQVNCASCPCVFDVGAGACPQCGGKTIRQENVAGHSASKGGKPKSVEVRRGDGTAPQKRN